MDPRLFDAKIIDRKSIPPRFCLIELEADERFLAASPGQFVMVRGAVEGTAPLLRRPMSIHDVVRKDAGCTFSLLVEVKGPGTRALCESSPGGLLSVLGPLGKGFPEPPDSRHPVLMAGGMGIAPLLFLGRRLREKGFSPTLLYGARTSAELVRIEALRAIGLDVRVCTDDGSAGRRGLASELLHDLLDSAGIVLYACGPRAMLKAAKVVIQDRRVPSYFSFEEYMGCGFGVCLGCSIESGGRPGTYLLTCKDGPVFDPFEVKLV
jgi:dihydroorotate dehydrogenase electron transfer subunit